MGAGIQHLFYYMRSLPIHSPPRSRWAVLQVNSSPFQSSPWISASTHTHSNLGPGLMLQSARGRGPNTEYPISVSTQPPDSCTGQWFSTESDSVPPPHTHTRSQKTLLIVTSLGHCYWHLQGKGQGCCSASHKAHNSTPPPKELSSPICQ